MTDEGLLTPGSQRSSSRTGDAAVLQAMLDVEAAWLGVQADLGLAPAAAGTQIEQVTTLDGYDVGAIAAAAEGGGNPVIPMLKVLRTCAGRDAPDAAPYLHRGLTSQDVLDSALMLVGQRVLAQVAADLGRAAGALVGLAETHRSTIMVGRTLGQHALPITFGLKAANWLQGLGDGAELLYAAERALPAQCGGAAGTLAGPGNYLEGSGHTALEMADRLAAALGLAAPVAPWHTNRSPITRLGDALVSVADAMGKIATDVLFLSRPEVAELSEPAGEGRGGSPAMPQKRNPVLSVLIRRTALAAPQLGAQLHLASVLAADERPDGAWHTEWPALRSLLTLVEAAAAQTAELLDGLVVHPEAMRKNLDLTGPALLSERIMARLGPLLGKDQVQALLSRSAGSDENLRELLREAVPAPSLGDQELERLLDPANYLGKSDALIDRLVDSYRNRSTP